MNPILAASDSFIKIAEFYEKGGTIMYALTLCSILTVAVLVFKWLDLGKKRVTPEWLTEEIFKYTTNRDRASARRVTEIAVEKESVLARLTHVAVQRKYTPIPQIRDAVQAKAHEEIVRLQGGIGVLDVVIVVAPLLGLLGTASGITTVFDGMSSLEDVKMNIMAQGVAEALTTTIAGLAVAVPAVIGHSFFNRKIETYAAQMEVVMEDLVFAISDDADMLL